MSDPTKLTLRYPVQFGSEAIEELTLKPTAKSMKDFTVQTKGDGTLIYEPYAAAKAGIHMAGYPNAVLDLMHPADMRRLGEAVMDFFGDGQPTGPTP